MTSKKEDLRKIINAINDVNPTLLNDGKINIALNNPSELTFVIYLNEFDTTEDRDKKANELISYINLFSNKSHKAWENDKEDTELFDITIEKTFILSHSLWDITVRRTSEFIEFHHPLKSLVVLERVEG